MKVRIMNKQKSYKSKKIFIIIISVITCVSLFVSLLISHTNRNVNVYNSPKNVILLIGDGMGQSHIKVAREVLNKSCLNMESFPVKGKVTTFSKMLLTTDSAASASAMATGKKTWNHMISQDKNGTRNESLTEIAIDHNMKTGVITSGPLYDATPAAFSSHTSSRKNWDDIISQQISSNIDLMIGEGKSEYDRFLNVFEENSKLYVNNFESLPADLSTKTICSLDEIQANNENILLECTKYSLDKLSNEQEGFFILIEGAKIDSESHENNLNNMVAELKAFDEVAQYCLDFAKNDKNTCVIITADHETGGLSFDSNDKISDELFSTNKHTGELVNYYFFPQNIADIPAIIDNTYIYRLINKIICDR